VTDSNNIKDNMYFINGNATEGYERAWEDLGDHYVNQGNFARGSSVLPTSFTAPNIDVRPHFNRLNYQSYRSGDAIPQNAADIMVSCRRAYEQVGLIRSVVDLMTEMAVEGLTLDSSNNATAQFYKAWSKRVSLKERAERFANYYLVEGNVVARRKMGDLSDSEVRRMKRTGTSGNNIKPDIEPGYVPLEYIFYEPSMVELIGGTLAMFAGVKQYGIVVTHHTLAELFRVDKRDRDRLFASLPEEIRMYLEGLSTKQINNFTKLVIPVPSDRLYVAHNKKLDHEPWAKSFIYSILHDVIYNEKLRLAKLSALDGWHNAIRLWKLGDHQHEILPDAGIFRKLADILKQHPGGIMDVLWDSMISMEDFYPPIEKLQSFDENVESMLLGLGVPRILVGGSEGAGVTNMFVGMKNLMKRIEGVRRALVEWLEFEIDIIQQNMGLRVKPSIKFSYQDLFDTQTYFKLVMDLYDRQLISDKSVLDKIGENFEIERQRAKEEHDLRESDVLAPRNGPFLQPRSPKENQQFQKEMQEMQTTDSPSEEEKPESPKQMGRPPGKRDEKPRNRRFRSKSSQLIMLGGDWQDKIDVLVDKAFLKRVNVSNKRQLTSEQKEELDQAKLQILASLHDDDIFLEDVSLDNLSEIVNNCSGGHFNAFMSLYKSELGSLDSTPTASQLRMIRSCVFAEINGI
jgi:hypothetical protein